MLKVFVLALLTLAACGPEKIDNPNFDAGHDSGGVGGVGGAGSGGTGGSGAVDGGAEDGGEDSSVDASTDGGDGSVPCSMTCGGDTPYCNRSTLLCVACLESVHCEGNVAGEVCSDNTCVQCAGAEGCDDARVCVSGGHECVECNEETDCVGNANGPACDDNTCVECLNNTHCESNTIERRCLTTDDGHECVECLADSDCNDAAEAKCNLATHECVPCTDNNNCDGITDGPATLSLCNSGTCVECTIATEARCGGDSCNPATRRCTDTDIDSVGTCGHCVADSECMNAQARCVPMNFQGTPRPGGYCLRMQTAGCTQPYATPVLRQSASGEPSQTYCGISEMRTTCEAVLDMTTGTNCTEDSDCGAEGLDDGRCETVGTLDDECTYACGSASQCDDDYACTDEQPYCH